MKLSAFTGVDLSQVEITILGATLEGALAVMNMADNMQAIQDPVPVDETMEPEGGNK